MTRLARLRTQLADERGHRVVLLSHCLLNENVRYLGGAGRAAGVQELVDGYLRTGVGVHQLPCPERLAWGGVDKRVMLLAFGSGWRGPLVRALVRPFVLWTSVVYRRLARQVAREVSGYTRAGVEVVAYVGVAGSPSCGAGTTLDLPAAVEALTRCPLRDLDRQTLNRRVIAANVVPGDGLFTCALRRRLPAGVAFEEHDLLQELGLRPARR